MTQAKWLLQAAAGVALALVVPLTVLGAEDKERGVGDVVYVPTPQVVVDEMLRMAKIGPKDFIIDLGSGDGRMVITAAKKFGAQGFGVDLLDPVDVLLVVFHRVDAVKGEGRKQGTARHRFPHAGHGGGDLFPQEMAAQAGFGPLGVLEFHYRSI